MTPKVVTKPIGKGSTPLDGDNGRHFIVGRSRPLGPSGLVVGRENYRTAIAPGRFAELPVLVAVERLDKQLDFLDGERDFVSVGASHPQMLSSHAASRHRDSSQVPTGLSQCFASTAWTSVILLRHTVL